MTKDGPAIKITMRDIYNELKEIKHDSNIQHNTIIHRLDITNGKVKLNRWLASTALMLVLTCVIYLIQHIQ
jgi:1,4-dihydroxy-2-naphthoate octaprenyltransferase